MHLNKLVNLRIHQISATNKNSTTPNTTNYPNNLDVTVTFTLRNNNSLRIDYKTTTNAPTMLNLTNHSYWNLSDEKSKTIYNERLQLNANHYTPTNTTQIPTGQIKSIRNTPMDFLHFHSIDTHIRDNFEQLQIGQNYDHN